MIDINIMYDTFTVIPSDVDKIENRLERLKEKYNFSFEFDEGKGTTKPNTLYISNKNIWKVEITNEDDIFVKTFSLDLIEDCIKRIEELHKEKNKKQ